MQLKGSQSLKGRHRLLHKGPGKASDATGSRAEEIGQENESTKGHGRRNERRIDTGNQMVAREGNNGHEYAGP